MAVDVVMERRVSRHEGVELVYRDYRPAEGAAGETVVLVHGLASSGLQFEADAWRFASAGYRVLVPDLRGHGATGVPQEGVSPAGFAIPVMAQDLVAMLNHAGVLSVHWVGNSLGGILALWLLGTEERGRIGSLSLFGTCFALNLPTQVGSVLRTAFLPGKAGTAWVTARTTTASASGRQAIMAAIAQFDVAAGAAIAGHVRQYDFFDNALAYERPLLVLYGGQDHAVNLALKGQLARFAGRPRFYREDLRRGGHCANFDMPDEFAAALERHWARTRVAALSQ